MHPPRPNRHFSTFTPPRFITHHAPVPFPHASPRLPPPPSRPPHAPCRGTTRRARRSPYVLDGPWQRNAHGRAPVHAHGPELHRSRAAAAALPARAGGGRRARAAAARLPVGRRHRLRAG